MFLASLPRMPTSSPRQWARRAVRRVRRLLFARTSRPMPFATAFTTSPTTRAATAAAAPPGDTQLTTQPKQIFKDIVDWMNLADQAKDGEVVRKLPMAATAARARSSTSSPPPVRGPAIFAIAASMSRDPALDYPVFVSSAMVTAASLLGYFILAVYVHNRIGQATEGDPPHLAQCTRSRPDLRRGGHRNRARLPESAEEMACNPSAGRRTRPHHRELSYSERPKAYQNLAMRTGLESLAPSSPRSCRPRSSARRSSHAPRAGPGEPGPHERSGKRRRQPCRPSSPCR